MKKKIGLISLGCPKNLVDSELMLGLLNKDEYQITNNENEAEIIIVNTCGFIESAKTESINTILEMANYKDQNCEFLIVTGCMAERYKEEIIKEIPEVDAVVGTGNYGDIGRVIEKLYSGEKQVLHGYLDAIEYLEGQRLVSTQRGYAYIKIAEGCDNCCTYCIIPSLRGRYRSRKIEDVVNEARSLAKSGVKELILVAQDTTRYGTDNYKQHKLVELIRKISDIEGIEWIRLLYCYPEEIDDALIDEIANNKKVCKYLDIPIQHISDKILKLMARRGTSKEIKDLITKVRQRIPNVIIRTSLIVGFPGEDENDFNQLYDFVKEFRFDRLGVFLYSKEEGTSAAKMELQVDQETMNARQEEIMKMQRDIAVTQNKSKINSVYRTLVEGVSDDGIFYFGRTFAEAPDIDNVIYFTSPDPLELGEFVDVKILNTDDYDLIGEVTNEFTK